MHEKSLTLLLVSDDDGTAVITGTVLSVSDGLIFEHGGTPSQFALPDDALERIRPVDASLREIIGEADFMLSLTVGQLDEAPSEDAEATGLKWPGGGAV